MRLEITRGLTQVLALCATVGAAVPALPATYYLAPGGDDAGPGSAERPWATLEHACALVGPGDTVLLAPGEYPGELRPAASGRPGAPIVFRAEPRRGAVLTGIPETDDAQAVVLEGRSDIRLEGLVVRPDHPRARWVRIHRSERIVLDDLLMEDIDNSLGLHVTESSDLRFIGCDLRLARRGSMARIEDSRRVVIEGCSFSRGAHDVLLLWPDRTNSEFVLRGNVLHPNTGRPMLIDAVGRVLFEDNIIVRSDDGGRSGSSRFAFDTSDSIFRHNRIYANWGSNLMIAGVFRDTLDFRGIRLYGNVFDHNTGLATDLYGGSEMIEDCVFANNVFSRNDRYGANRQLRVRSGTAEDLVFAANLFDGSVQLGYKVLTVEQAEAVSAGVFVGNVVADPQYRDAGAYDHRPAAGSPMIDGGRTLTHAVGAGSGRLPRVDNTRWFYDGFGIEGERDDVIAVGPDQLQTRIERIDHEASILHLDRELRWEDGAQVSLPFSGDAPDIGAFEVGDRGRPTVQVLAEPAQVAPGESVRLRAVLHGGGEPTGVRWALGDGEVAEGEEVTHRYADAYDYPVRVAVTDAEGIRRWGASFVLVEQERPADAPLLHSTFGATDDDAWWRWMCNRPMPQAHEFLPDGPTDGGMLRVFAREDGYQLGAQTQPRGWDLGRYPHVMMRYRIAPGTPLIVSVFAFATAESSRGVRVAQTTAAQLPAGDVALAEPLIDDGGWHELRFDAAALLRAAYGADLTMGKVLGIRANDPDLVKAGHEYFLDEVIIGPAP
ncbi:MAG: right-handed parallel beta-helix repeat-containing protein [Armatimonadota bacterium]